MKKPSCIYCDQPVLVSKQSSMEMSLHPITGEMGRFLAHNECLSAASEACSMERLVRACDGNAEQAALVRAALLAAPGSLVTRRIR